MDSSSSWALSRRWILVAGTGVITGLPKNEQFAARSVGRQLAINKFGIVTGGWDGVDYIVAESFIDQLIQQKDDPGEYLIQVIPEQWEPKQSYGHVVRIPPGGREWLEPQKFAEAVILIGGKGGTYRAWLSALHDGLPRFPFGGTWGDAAQAFLDTRDLWEVIPVPGITKSEFEILGKPIKSESDAEWIADYIVTNLLLRSLNAIDANSRNDVTAAPSIFISYSRTDLDWVTRIRTLLRPAERRGMISTWVDADIRVGEHWEPQIIEKINKSESALLLVTNNVLKSKYVREIELPVFASRMRQENGRFRFYWSLIEPCNWESVPELNKVQAIGSTEYAVSESQTKADEQCRLIEMVDIITRSSRSWRR